MRKIGIHPLSLLGLFLLLAAFSSCATSRTERTGLEDPLFEEGYQLYLSGRYERASALFTKIIRSRGGREHDDLIAHAYRFRGACRKATRQYSQACFDYEMAIQVTEAADPPIPEGHGIVLDCGMEIGDIYLYQGFYRKADASFESLLEESPTVACRDSLLFRRYICAVKLGDPDPERFINRIDHRGHYDEAALREAFLGGGTPTARYGTRAGVKDAKNSPPVASLQFLDRAEWNPRSIRSNISPMTTIQKITVHHTGTVWEGMSRRESANRIRSHQKTHQDVNGWADVGYHFIIDRAGRIWEGRPLRYQGAHAGNAQLNKGNVGVSLMGNYNQQHLTREQEEVLSSFLAYFCNRYRIDPSMQILTHKEIRPEMTECPGTHLQEFIDTYRERRQ